MAVPSTKWRRRKDARPPEILAAALILFSERGYAATRLDDVARRAGVTKGTLYLYFPNKEALFTAVIRATLVPTLMQIGEAPPGQPVAITLGELLVKFRTLAATPVGAIPKIVLGEAGNFPELARIYLDEVVTRGLDGIRALLQQGIDSGEFRPFDAESGAYCVVAPLVLALLWTHSFGPIADRQLDTAALCNTHLDLLLNGLRPREIAP